jgi:hypothetical protein
MNLRNSTHSNKLLTPSWLSGLVAIMAGLAMSVGVIVAFHVANNSFRQQLTALSQTQQHQQTLTQPGELPPAQNNSLQANVPVLVLFAFAGVAIYSIATGLVNSVRSLAQIRREINYVNARPKSLLKEFSEQAGLRLGALLVWALFTTVFVRRIIPYAITSAHASAVTVLSVSGIKDAFFAFIVVTLSMHLHAIFLRLVSRRVRVFAV